MMHFDRRHLLIALGTGLISARAARGQSLQDDIARRLAAAEGAGKVAGLHALLVSQAGRLVFEHYGRGEDETHGHPLGTVAFDPDVLHDLRSVSKSVVSLAYGIALAEGKVPPPDARLYEQFPQYPDLAIQPGRDRLTVHHLLSMTLGFEWDELTVPYGVPGNSWNAMDAAPDPYRFTLERPMIAEPGAKWGYCGGATDLLGLLIAKGTGEELPAYCRRVLFDPLQFGASDWYRGRHRKPIAASGLRLLPRDLVKIGQLMLGGGRWNGRQVVPESWITRATTPAVTIEGDFKYGYHWYIGMRPDSPPQSPPRFIAGIGWGGQRLHLSPARDLVIVIHCGNYARPAREQRSVIDAVMTQVLLPSFV